MERPALDVDEVERLLVGVPDRALAELGADIEGDGQRHLANLNKPQPEHSTGPG